MDCRWLVHAVVGFSVLALNLNTYGAGIDKRQAVEVPIRPSGGGMAYVKAVGRMEFDRNGALYAWPGIYFEGRFRGTQIGLRFDDQINLFDVLVDDVRKMVVRRPGKVTLWVPGVGPGEHTVRVARRSEAPGQVGRFLGFVVGQDSAMLAPPAASPRQMEFVGDAHIVGSGLGSSVPRCADSEVFEGTDTQLSYGMLVARHFGADAQINGYSGLGLIHNASGMTDLPGFRVFYERTYPGMAEPHWSTPPNWRPQVVVIGLGINDFSSLPSDQRIADPLKQQFKQAYKSLLDDIRQRYGPDTWLVLTATDIRPPAQFKSTIREIVVEARAADDPRVLYFEYGDLDLCGCHGLPSERDHQVIARRLIGLLETAGVKW